MDRFVDSVRQQHLLRLEAQMLSNPGLYLGPFRILGQICCRNPPQCFQHAGGAGDSILVKVES